MLLSVSKIPVYMQIADRLNNKKLPASFYLGALHEVLIGKWNYVGQATVSKFIEEGAGTGRFRQEFTSDSSHLSDKENLRAAD